MLQTLAHFVLESVFYLTGYGLLRLITLGRWNARQDRHDVAAVVGLCFWFLVGLATALAR
jgi:hypothetical protein